MAAGDLKRLSVLIGQIGGIGRDRTSDVFRTAALTRLGADIAFDRAIWADATIGGGMDLRAPELFRIAPVDRADYERAAFADPRLGVVLGAPGIAHAYSVGADDPADYRAMTEALDLRHFLSIAHFDPDLGIASGLVLFRGSWAPPFADDERDFAEAAFPHLMTSWTRCQVDELIGQTRFAPGLETSTVISDGLRLIAAEPAFSALMKREWPEWRGPALPPAMLDSGTGVSLARYDGAAIAVRSRASVDRALLIARARSPVDTLTHRQRAVAILSAEGLTYREIAARLNLAPATARNHLAAVHRRLGVTRNSEIGRMIAVSFDGESVDGPEVRAPR